MKCENYISALSVFLLVATSADDVHAQKTSRWNLDRIDQRDQPLSGTYEGMDNLGNIYNGAGVHVYVVDHQIQTTHVTLAGRTGIGYVAYPVTGTADLCESHGTHVAGIAGGGTFGVARGVTLHSVKIYPCWILFTGEDADGNVVEKSEPDSFGWANFGWSWGPRVSDAVKALDWIRTNHYVNYPGRRAVVNMSFTVREGAGTPADLTSLDLAVNRLIDAGIVVVIAAANENADACLFSPARVPRAITVAASTELDEKLSISNWGPCIDLFAPGENIRSAAWSKTSTIAAKTDLGTSMAAPHVAGVAAFYLQRDPTMTVAGVRTAIVNSSTSGALSGNLGAGTRNQLLYFGPHGFFPAKGSNLPPVAVNNNLGDFYSGDNDNRIFFPLDNDYDPDGNALAVVSVTQPAGGSVSFTGKEFYLIPGATVGSKSFSYTVTDGRGGTATAVVSYRVLR